MSIASKTSIVCFEVFFAPMLLQWSHGGQHAGLRGRRALWRDLWAGLDELFFFRVSQCTFLYLGVSGIWKEDLSNVDAKRAFGVYFQYGVVFSWIHQCTAKNGIRETFKCLPLHFIFTLTARVQIPLNEVFEVGRLSKLINIVNSGNFTTHTKVKLYHG